MQYKQYIHTYTQPSTHELMRTEGTITGFIGRNAASFGIAGFNDPSAQLCALAAGLVVFIVCNVAACKLSARSFAHFDA